MTLKRLAGPALLSIIAVSAIAASSASARIPSHYLGPLQVFTIHFSPLLWLGGTAKPSLHCAGGGRGTGEAHPLPLNNFLSIVIKFTECNAEENGTRCGTIKSSSPAGAEGEIITNTLRALLGAIDGTLLDPAIIIQAQTGTTLTTLGAVAGCTNAIETAVKGSVIGLILLPLFGLRLDLHILFNAKHNILLANGVLDKYTLEAYGLGATLDALALLLFEKEFEIC